MKDRSDLAIGLMSGTSADGVSAVLAEFTGKKFKICGFKTFPYPSETRALIRKGPTLSAKELSILNFTLGHLFAEAALKLLKICRVKPARVTCIGSHGQTIYHGPGDKSSNTLQIGEPAVIAEETKIAVVSHFRERDIAAGGEGAPLIPFFEQYFFGDGPTRAFQNIGGIANVTVVGINAAGPLAFDTGPGNCLMDEAMRIISRGRKNFDKDGGLAGRGEVDLRKIEQMMKDDYFRDPPPKSTGLDKFGREFLLRFFQKDLQKNPENVLATLNFFTCLSIQEGFRNFIFPKFKIEEIVVSGGGAKNKFLLKNLRRLFNPIPVIPIDKIGIPSQAKEPLAFAFLGLRAIQGKINHLPQTTGAQGQRVLGRVTYA